MSRIFSFMKKKEKDDEFPECPPPSPSIKNKPDTGGKSSKKAKNRSNKKERQRKQKSQPAEELSQETAAENLISTDANGNSMNGKSLVSPNINAGEMVVRITSEGECDSLGDVDSINEEEITHSNLNDCDKTDEASEVKSTNDSSLPKPPSNALENLVIDGEVPAITENVESNIGQGASPSSVGSLLDSVLDEELNALENEASPSNLDHSGTENQLTGAKEKIENPSTQCVQGIVPENDVVSKLTCISDNSVSNRHLSTDTAVTHYSSCDQGSEPCDSLTGEYYDAFDNDETSLQQPQTANSNHGTKAFELVKNSSPPCKNYSHVEEYDEKISSGSILNSNPLELNNDPSLISIENSSTEIRHNDDDQEALGSNLNSKSLETVCDASLPITLSSDKLPNSGDQYANSSDSRGVVEPETCLNLENSESRDADENQLNNDPLKSYDDYLSRDERNINQNCASATVQPAPIEEILIKKRCESKIVAQPSGDQNVPLSCSNSLDNKLGEDALQKSSPEVYPNVPSGVCDDLTSPNECDKQQVPSVVIENDSKSSLNIFGNDKKQDLNDPDDQSSDSLQNVVCDSVAPETESHIDLNSDPSTSDNLDTIISHTGKASIGNRRNSLVNEAPINFAAVENINVGSGDEDACASSNKSLTDSSALVDSAVKSSHNALEDSVGFGDTEVINETSSTSLSRNSLSRETKTPSNTLSESSASDDTQANNEASPNTLHDVPLPTPGASVPDNSEKISNDSSDRSSKSSHRSSLQSQLSLEEELSKYDDQVIKKEVRAVILPAFSGSFMHKEDNIL